ncbi:MAG: uncharacterized protein QOF92_3729 [Pseudonocardiales bacterium]|jgi:uncharacterized protein YbaR (Trm112 family)|nr:uncharacterized protein [Pseudonocardiales bacterium]
MPLNATLLEMLACPSDDHAPLREDNRGGAPVLVCTFCESTYPIEDGIPVLLLDEAEPGPRGIGIDASAESSAGQPLTPEPSPDPDGQA